MTATVDHVVSTPRPNESDQLPELSREELIRYSRHLLLPEVFQDLVDAPVLRYGQHFACEVRELIFAAIRIEQISRKERVVFDTFESDVEAIE